MSISYALLLLALTSPRVVRASPAVDAYARFVVGVRRVFPDLMSTAAEHNVNLPHLAARAFDLMADLGPLPPRVLETIRVDRVVPSTVTEDFVEPKSLAARRETFARVARSFSPKFDRARLVARVRDELETSDEEPSADLVDLVRFAIWSDGVEDVFDQLEEFTITDLRAFRTRREFKARFARLRAELSLGPEALRRLAEVRRRVRHGVVEYGQRAHQLHTESLILSEMAPELALAKGFLAHDCSSRECFGYPLAPTERVFALRRRDGGWRGLASVSRVTVGGKPSLYVNTLSGLNLNADLTRLALAGLRQLLVPGETLSLPTAACLAVNCNFSIVRAALGPLIAERAMRPLVYADPREREIIERYSLRPYDRMDAHAVAHTIHLPSLDDPDLRFTRTAGSGLGWAPDPPAPGELIEALVDVIASLRFEMARDFWTHLGRPPAEVDELIALLTNVAGRSRADFVAAVTERLVALDVDPGVARARATHPTLLGLAHLVAADGLEPGARAATFAAVVRTATSARRILRTDAFRAWLDRLDAGARDEVLFATLNALEAYRRDSKREFVTAELVPSLIDASDFARRAREFNARGIHWTTLAQAAETFVTSGPDRVQDGEVASTRFIADALRTAGTAAEFRAMFTEMLATSAHSARVVTALGSVLDRVRTLGFNDAGLEDLSSGFGGGRVLIDLLRWTTRPIERVGEFVAIAETWITGATGLRLTLVRAALIARGTDVLRAGPTPIEIARFRTLATARGGAADRAFLDEVLVTYPRVWSELPVLARGDAGDDEDASLWRVGRDHLDRLTTLLEDAPDTGPRVRRSVTRLAREVQRNARLRHVKDAAGWLGVMRAYPRLALTTAQVREFVARGPSVAQFRELIEYTDEIRGYGRPGAALVRTIEDLVEITRPIELTNLDHFAVRAEFLALIDEVARAPGAAAHFREVDLDRVMSAVGLDIRRNEIAPLAGPLPTCAAALTAAAKP